MTIMMLCGHASNATDGATGKPCCVICFPAPGSMIEIPKPDLTGRTSVCSDKCPVVPSTWNLPFFEYRGPGCAQGQIQCRDCGFNRRTHADQPDIYDWVIERKSQKTHPFVAQGSWETDRHYDGCRGWD